jgi:L-lactate utilization protein LutB
VTDKREVRRKLRDLRERRDGPDDLEADDDTPREVKAYRGVDLSAFPGVPEDVLERAEEPGGRVVVGEAAEDALENAEQVVASDADTLAEDREQGASDGDTEPGE